MKFRMESRQRDGVLYVMEDVVQIRREEEWTGV